MADPIVPPDVDLRDFPYMPVDIARLFGSAFHARSTDAEWRAGVTLWLKSFHQVPAASLPDDDIDLARLAELGRDVRSWRKVRDMALHGWVKAADGRLYHPVVAEKALEAWLEKLGQRKSSGMANAKRWNAEFDEAAIDRQIMLAIEMLTALNPHSRALRRRLPRTSAGNPDGTPGNIPSGSQEKEKGKGKGRDIGAAPPIAGASASGTALSLERILREAAGLTGSDARALGNTAPIQALIDEGVSLEAVILPALRSVAAERRQGKSWSYYLGAIQDRRSGGAAVPSPAAGTVPDIWVRQDSPEGEAWEAHERAQGRMVRWLPSDRRGVGRSMPTRWPPGHDDHRDAA